jgi:aminoglycoside phosphotransferase (APT) family kinase protein
VPEFIAASSARGDADTHYLLYRYVHGQTFRDIRARCSRGDLADAAFAIGQGLSQLKAVDSSSLVAYGLEPRFSFAELSSDSPLLLERLAREDVPLLQAFRSEWSPRLRRFATETFLVHGDFNHRNIVLDRKNGSWHVSALLDWELAATGSYLWDAARFTCYDKPDSHYWEDSFVEGLRAGGIELSTDWRTLLGALNILSAIQGLGSPSLREQFIPELRALVHNGLRGKRIR